MPPVPWLFLVAALAQPTSPPVAPPPDPCESAVIAQVRAALGDLKGAPGSQSEQVTSVVFQGTIAVEGHLMRPGMVRTVPARLEIVEAPESPAGSSVLLREIAGRPGAEETETTIVRCGRVAHQRSSDEPFTELSGEEAVRAAAELTRWLPDTAVRAAIAAAPSCRPGVPVEFQGATLHPVTYVEAPGHVCSLLLDSDHRPVRIESLSAHPRLGDTCEWTRFADWNTEAGVVAPGRLSRFFAFQDATQRYDLARVSLSRSSPTADDFALPPSHRGDIPDWGSTPPVDKGMSFVQLAPSVWAVEIEASNSRAMVIERDTDLVLLGAPDGDAVCGGLARALAARFAGKPIGVVSVSHHHPSPSGGLRAVAAAGARVVVPEALEPFAKEFLARPATLGPPAVAGPADPSLTTFNRTTTIECRGVTIQLLDIAERSAHAFSYVVFYIPELGVLFEDDLGYFPADGSFRIGPRLAGLVEQVSAAGFKPTRLIPGWPVRNASREVAWSAVVERIAAERDRAPSAK